MRAVRRILHRVLRHDLNILFQLVFDISFKCGNFSPCFLTNSLQEFSNKHDMPNAVDTENRINSISFDSFEKWCSTNVPSLHEPLRHTLMTRLFNSPSLPPILMGEKKRESISSSEIISMTEVFALSCCDARCQGPWDMLFSSNQNGMSFDSLAHTLIGYAGPTLLVVLDSEGNVFGGLSSEPWRESGQFFGRSDSIMFSLQPHFAAIRARSENFSSDAENYQYLKVRGRQGLLGLGYGGDMKRGPRFFLDHNFENCHASDFCLTYDQGALRTGSNDKLSINSEFTPIIIECWGFGGEDAKNAQAKERNDLNRIQTDMRTVDRRKFCNNEFDREFLLGKNFQASNSKQER